MKTEADETNDESEYNHQQYDNSYYGQQNFAKSGGNGASAETNSQQHDVGHPIELDSGQSAPLDPATQELLEEMQREVKSLDPQTHKNAIRLLQREMERLSNFFEPDLLEVDIPKPIKIMRKVKIPVQRNPKFNFVGKLLGPGGKTLQNLISTTRCRIYILGKGSTRDKAKEDEQIASGDPKYAHLNEPLHIRVESSGPPTVAYQKLAHVFNELQYFLQPVKDDIYAQQMADLGMPIAQPPVPVGPPMNSPMGQPARAMRGSLMGPGPGPGPGPASLTRGGITPRGSPRGGGPGPSRGRGGLIQTPPGPLLNQPAAANQSGGPPPNYVTYPGFDYGGYGDYQQNAPPQQAPPPQYGVGHGPAPHPGPPAPVPGPGPVPSGPSGGPPPPVAPPQSGPPPGNYGPTNAYTKNYSYGYEYNQYNQPHGPPMGQGPPQRPPGPMPPRGGGKAPPMGRGRGMMPRPAPY